MNAIEIKHLSKYYGVNRGIEDISLEVKAGEIYGFIGQNGSGKSTTIRILLNMIFPTSGEAKIYGLDCVQDSKEIKKFLGYVPSEVTYYPMMKVIDLFNYASLLGDICDNQRIEDLCTYFELDKNRLIKELSFGNRKKVSIIQALLKNPKVILLDEPTSGLDPLIQDKLFKLLLKEKEKGICIFLSSHNLSEVEKYCDRVCVIKDGRVVQIDSMKNLNKQRKIKVNYLTSDNQAVSYIYDGNINDLSKHLATLDLQELEIRHSTLEEEFMKFYEEDHDER